MSVYLCCWYVRDTFSVEPRRKKKKDTHWHMNNKEACRPKVPKVRHRIAPGLAPSLDFTGLH